MHIYAPPQVRYVGFQTLITFLGLPCPKVCQPCCDLGECQEPEQRGTCWWGALLVIAISHTALEIQWIASAHCFELSKSCCGSRLTEDVVRLAYLATLC